MIVRILQAFRDCTNLYLVNLRSMIILLYYLAMLAVECVIDISMSA